MNTHTGRVYEEPIITAAEMRGPIVPVDGAEHYYVAAADPLTREDEIQDCRRALGAGHAVPVSPVVVQQLRVGQRDLRRRRRRQAKVSRKRNR